MIKIENLTLGKFTLFQDLALDPSLFEMDSSQDYQFEIYKLMKQATLDDWQLFKPITNVYWMHYLVDKCLNQVK